MQTETVLHVKGAAVSITQEDRHKAGPPPCVPSYTGKYGHVGHVVEAFALFKVSPLLGMLFCLLHLVTLLLFKY